MNIPPSEIFNPLPPDKDGEDWFIYCMPTTKHLDVDPVEYTNKHILDWCQKNGIETTYSDIMIFGFSKEEDALLCYLTFS